MPARVACSRATILVAGLFMCGAAEAITLHQPGYTASVFASMYQTSSESPRDLEVDGLGNLYVALGAGGIYKVTPTGVISTWATWVRAGTPLRSRHRGSHPGFTGCN